MPKQTRILAAIIPARLNSRSDGLVRRNLCRALKLFSVSTGERGLVSRNPEWDEGGLTDCSLWKS
ncbi:MAG: hypothetical protein IIB82_17035 [Bacteroidetes bacterium]|nr:hypothetical protein [Bacteroidota bacterium]